MTITFKDFGNETSAHWQIKSKSYNGKKIDGGNDVVELLEDFVGISLTTQNNIFNNDVFVAVSQQSIAKILTRLKTKDEFIDKDSLVKTLEKIYEPMSKSTS